MKYNVLAGMDNTMFNNVINQVYTAIYPQLFKGKIDINSSNVSTIEFDMNKSPTVNLRRDQKSVV